MVSSPPFKWMDFTPVSLLFQVSHFPKRCWHETQDDRFRQSEASCLQQFSLILHQVVDMGSYHSFSDPTPRNDQCPRVNLRAYSVTLWGFVRLCFCLSSFLKSMSLYIDKEMILPLKRSSSHFICKIIIFWISLRNYLPEIALSQKRRKFFPVANWSALSVSRVVSLHMRCCQSIVVSPVISVWSVIINCLKDFLGWFSVDRRFSV